MPRAARKSLSVRMQGAHAAAPPASGEIKDKNAELAINGTFLGRRGRLTQSRHMWPDRLILSFPSLLTDSAICGRPIPVLRQKCTLVGRIGTPRAVLRVSHPGGHRNPYPQTALTSES